MAIIVCFAALCGSIFTSFLKEKGIFISNGINLIVTLFLSIQTLFLNEINFFGIITITYPDNVVLSFLGFINVISIIYGDLRCQRETQTAILHSFIFLTSYVFLGFSDWINIFICYKLIVLGYYSLLDTKDDKSSKNIFISEMQRSIILVLAIIFYFLGTKSFSFDQQAVANQDFFLISLSLFALFTAMEMGLFPFHIWLRAFLEKNRKEKLNFYILSRKIIFSYFMIETLAQLSMACEPAYGELFLNIIKGYVLVNIIVGSIFLLIHKNMMKIISSFAMINMSQGYLYIILRQKEIFKEHLIFYLFCTLLPLLGISLVSDIIYNRENNDYSYKKFAGMILNNPHPGIYFSVFLLAMVGFPLTMGFSGKLLLFLDMLVMEKQALIIGLIFIYFFSMQVGLKTVGYMFSKNKQVIEKVELDRRHLWIHPVLAFLVAMVGLAPSLFLTMPK